MLEKIRKWIDRVKYNRSKQSCYDPMERQGVAVLGMCCGVVGGIVVLDIWRIAAAIVRILLLLAKIRWRKKNARKI